MPQSSQNTNRKQTYMHFGRKVNVLFADGKWYEGEFTGKDPKTEYWLTEDSIEDPQCDKEYKLLN